MQKRGHKKAYAKYLERCPNGIYLEEAQSRIDFLDFKPYKEEDSISSYKQFIQENPNNKYVKDAKARIDELIYTDYREKGILMGP